MSKTGQALGVHKSPNIGEWVRHMPPPRPKPAEAENQESVRSDQAAPDVEMEQIRKNTERPAWYGSESGQDVIDVAEDFGIVDNAYKFNMLKYLLRGGKKASNSELQDMIKIRVYLDRYIEKLRKGE